MPAAKTSPLASLFAAHTGQTRSEPAAPGLLT
jgi:hypothetical protein